MTSIRRTAYPYFHAHQEITPQELVFFYSLTAAEQHTIKNIFVAINCAWGLRYN